MKPSRTLHGRRLTTVKQAASTPGYDCYSVQGIYHLINNSKDRYASDGIVIKGNGFDVVVIKVGRKVLIDLDAFDEWLESHRVASNNSDAVGG